MPGSCGLVLCRYDFAAGARTEQNVRTNSFKYHGALIHSLVIMYPMYHGLTHPRPSQTRPRFFCPRQLKFMLDIPSMMYER